MIAAPELDLACPLTDGAIAVNNLESARQRAWSRFWRDPLQPGVAEYIIEQEQLTAQFAGDLGVLDRLARLVNHLDRVDATSPRTALLHAQVAAMAHRFVEAKSYLKKLEDCADLREAANRLSLSIDQACGIGLDDVLEARKRMAADSGRLEDLLPLGALYADLRDFNQADQIYLRAFAAHQETSPFSVAWVCFQLGVLWGELVPEAQLVRAAGWYLNSIECLPCYVKARVHLAEIYLRLELLGEAEALLIPALSSGDPEVNWRLADVLGAMGRVAEAEAQMRAAQTGFEHLLDKQLLAFADHGAEFYAGSGNDSRRALELASINLANRPTLRAFEQAYGAAIAAGLSEDAAKVFTAAKNSWGTTNAFRLSPLVERELPAEGVA
jgi:hypothetical protein